MAEDFLENLRVGIEVHCVEGDGYDLAGTGGVHACGGVIQRLASTGGQDHARGAAGEELLDDGEAHVGRAAEQQDGLGFANGINHCDSLSGFEALCS